MSEEFIARLNNSNDENHVHTGAQSQSTEAHFIQFKKKNYKILGLIKKKKKKKKKKMVKHTWKIKRQEL